MIKINIDWKGEKGFNNLIRYISDNLIYAQAQQGIRVLGHHTADHMRKTISTSKKRPDKGTHKLENSITAETLTTTGGVEVGIGRISKMTAEAPYWEVLNDGGYIPPANIGYFADWFRAPEPGGYGEDWKHTGKGSEFQGLKFYFMKPKKPIEGIDYVGKSIRNLDNELKEMVKNLGGTWLDGMNKTGKSMFGATYVKSWGKRVTFGGKNM